MKREIPFTMLFPDVGRCPAYNGWQHLARQRATETFGLPWAELEVRAKLSFALKERLRWMNIGFGWLSTKGDRSPGLSFGASCSRNNNLICR